MIILCDCVIMSTKNRCIKADEKGVWRIRMTNRNICKFNQTTGNDQLNPSMFIFETRKDVMQKPKTLEEYRVFLFSQGEGSLLCQGVQFPFRNGTVFFGFPDETISIMDMSPDNNDMPVSYLYISFDGKRAERLLRRFGISEKERCFHGYESLIPFWQNCLSRTPQENIDIVSEAVLLYTFSSMKMPKKQENALIFSAIEYLEEHFSDAELTIGSVAKKFGYNEKYLSHAFSKEMNVGFSEYLQTLRIKHAVMLFDNGIISVKNAAWLSGFRDQFYFSSIFKKHIGISPKEYIRRKSNTSSDEQVD